LVREICRLIDARVPRPDGLPRESQIAFVEDRPGHDRRYAIDAGKIRRELGWGPSVTFEQGLGLTLDWYLANSEWVQRAQTGRYRGERLGQRA
jgi:dTDP-glucose 4,6-dehydratase